MYHSANEQIRETIDLLDVIRARIEYTGIQAKKDRYHDGDANGWTDYHKGIQDACRIIDDAVTQLNK